MPSEFQSFLEDLFAPLGGVSLRRMFGGIGAFHGGIIFALVVDDVLYMKTDATTVPAYIAEGSTPWVYQGRHRVSKPTAYWRLPERLYDEPEEFRDWALTAIRAAERSKAAPKTPRAGLRTRAGKKRGTAART